MCRLSDDTLKDMRERETWSVRQNRVFSETPYEANEEEVRLSFLVGTVP